MNKSCRCRPAQLRRLSLATAAAVALAGAAGSAHANQGLTAPRSSDWLWPRMQARIALQTTGLAPATPARLGAPAGVRGVQGGALLGDYVFATPGLGNFRATSGVMLGGPAGAPVLFSAPSARLGVTVFDNGLAGGSGSSESAGTLPYLGLGYNSAALWRSLSLSADVGWVAARPAGLGGLGRAMLGNQALDAAVRDLRLAPVLQLGVRYSF